MRLKSEIWVKAYIRRCYGEGVPAMVVRKGDHDAGAIYILVNGLDGRNWLYCPAPTGFGDPIVGRSWSLYPPETVLSEADANTYLSNQFRSDPDIWVIELEDKDGRHFLEDALIEF
ncbi:hypothetical protein MnTg02_02475 [bacterium MnTg02]|nr:hypothetical protein MnTg02_02475 [bacterium MnTg02]